MLLGQRSGGGAWLAPLVAGGCAALAYAPWVWIARSIPSIDEGYPDRMRFSVIAEQLGQNGPLVAEEFALTFGSPLAWLLLWPAFGLALAWAARSPGALLAGDACLPTLLVLAGLGLYASILVVTPWDLSILFHTGIPDRLFVHLAPAAAFATLALMHPREVNE